MSSLEYHTSRNVAELERKQRTHVRTIRGLDNILSTRKEFLRSLELLKLTEGLKRDMVTVFRDLKEEGNHWFSSEEGEQEELNLHFCKRESD